MLKGMHNIPEFNFAQSEAQFIFSLSQSQFENHVTWQSNPQTQIFSDQSISALKVSQILSPLKSFYCTLRQI